jgi:hypothetical protein
VLFPFFINGVRAEATADNIGNILTRFPFLYKELLFPEFARGKKGGAELELFVGEVDTPGDMFPELFEHGVGFLGGQGECRNLEEDKQQK